MTSAIEIYRAEGPEDAIREFVSRIRQEVEAHSPDISTEAGRKAIASLAYKVAQAKTAADAAGKQMGDEARQVLERINGYRKSLRDQLQALQDDARRPLTEWEDREKQRVDHANAMISGMKGLLRLTTDSGLDVLELHLREWSAVLVEMPAFADFMEEAQLAKAEGLAHLERQIAAARKIEAERAELERLRAEAERFKQEQIAVLAEVQRKEAEDKRVAEAEQRARSEAAAAAARLQQAEIDRIRSEERARTLEAEREAEMLRKAQMERDLAEREARIQQEAREKDAAHRRSVRKSACDALEIAFPLDLSTELAERIFDSIQGGEIPHVRVVL